MGKAENQVNDLEHRKKKIQSNHKKKKIISKNDNKVRRLWGNFKHINIRIIGVLEGEEKEQELENLLEKIMKERFPYLVKEINIPFRKQRESQTRWTQRRPHQDTS